MYGTTKILSLIVHLVGLIGQRPIESSGPLQFGHYPNPTTMKFLTTNFRNRLNALQAMARSVAPLLHVPATRRVPPHTCCELESALRSKRTYASPPHRAKLRLDGKLARMAVCCGSREGEQPPTSAHQRRSPPHGGELRQTAGTAAAGRTTARRRPRAGPEMPAGWLFSNGEMGQNRLYDFGLDQLDLLGDHACAGRIWLLPPRSLRAMVLPQSAQRDSRRGSRGSRSDAASSNRNGALKQGKCRHCFEVSLAVEAERIAATIAKLPDGCVGRPTAGRRAPRRLSRGRRCVLPLSWPSSCPPRAASRRLGSSRSTTTPASL
jgi:hypothetical protein